MDYIPWQTLHESLIPTPEPPGLKQEDIQARYGDIQKELEAGGSNSIAQRLRYAFGVLLSKSNVDNISKCICTSLGSFTATKYVEKDKQPNRPLYQLFAFEIMKMALEDHLRKKIDLVRFQDPEMNNMDKLFLQTLGYEVIDHPRAWEEVARDVFVYTPGAPFVHVRDMLHHAHPAVYVGVDLEQWLESKK
ncbi:MAG: hypothetical protein Q9223_000997 [Gallowayella weberi]